MSRKTIILLFAVLLAVAATAVTAQAETLRWNAVTTYTDGSSISATVTYQVYWSTSSSLTNLHALGSSTTSTSRSFDLDSAGMPRSSPGNTSRVYFVTKATVGGVDSALSSSLSWIVPEGTTPSPPPPAPTPVPSAPTNLRMN
jgi:hypothetical protein